MNETVQQRSNIVFVVAGMGLIASFSVISWLSRDFVYGENHELRPIPQFVGVYLLSWGFFLAALWSARTAAKRLFPFAILIAILLRVVLWNSNPIQEHDFYRYTWDGQVLLHGINPFRDAPADIGFEELAPTTAELDDAILVKERTAYPEVKTIYPHLAQFVFVQNAFLWGWDTLGFRKTLLVYDVLLMLLAFLVVRTLKLPRLVVIAVAWCPLLLKEVTNAMHIDIVSAVLLCLFVLAVYRNKYVLAILSLFFAAWVKVTPLLLFPLLAAYLWRRGERKALFIGTMVAGGLGLLSICSMYWGASDPFAGLKAFSAEWQNNSAVHWIMLRGLHGLGLEHAQTWTRHLLQLAFLGFLAWQTWKVRSRKDLVLGAGNTLFVLFLLSPVGNPWYLIWLLPFILITPRPHWIALMICTSLYYLNFTIRYHELGAQAYDRLQFAEYFPILLVLLIQWLRSARKRENPKAVRESLTSVPN